MRQAATFWLLAMAVLAAGALLSCGEASCALAALDRSGLALADSLRAGWLDRLMLAATWLGSLWLLLPLAGAAGWRLAHGNRGREAGFLVAALASAAGLAQVVKAWVMRPRPDLFPGLLDMPADWSYPSGHAVQASAFAVAVCLLASRRRALWGIVLGAAALLVGASRVYLQVHFPSDVVAGMLAAGLWVAGLHALVFRRAPGRGGQADG